MKTLVLTLALVLASVLPAVAQTPIILGPSSVFAFDVVVPTPALAQSLTYVVTPGALAPITLTGVACSGATPATTPVSQTCSVPATMLPLGALSVTMTSASGGVTSVPSAVFAYIDLVIPIPTNLRLK